MAAACIGGGALLGAATNAINARVSPVYFRYVLRWADVRDIWRAVMAQGIYEGLMYGSLFAVVFTLSVGVSSRGRADFRFTVRPLLTAACIALGGWVMGGVLAIGLASLSPEFYRLRFRGVPDAFGEMLAYAWVGGSIWGILIGAVLAAVVSTVVAGAHWRAQQQN